MQNSEAVTHLYGFSYPTRHVEENQLVKYIKKEGADFHIGILHGHFEGIVIMVVMHLFNERANGKEI